jgi:hypothetical protein
MVAYACPFPANRHQNMHKRIGFWLCALTLVFAAGQARAVEPDPCIPPDTIFAMKIRPRQILTSALVKDLGWDELFKTTLAADEPVQEFLETAGLRIERDLESILFCMPSSPIVADPDAPPQANDPETEETIRPDQPAGEKPAKPWLMVLRGKFSPKKITRALESQGISAGAPIRKLKGARTALLQIESELGPIFVGFDGNRKMIVSNQLERLKAGLAGSYDKPVSSLFRASMEYLTDHESFWMAHSNEGDLKSDLEKELKTFPKLIWKHLNSCQLGLTVSHEIQGKLTYSNQNPASANAIQAELAFDIKIWKKEVEMFLSDPTSLIPKEILGNKEYSWINMMALWEFTIPYSAARLSKMEVQGNDTVFLIEANRKSLEPLLQVFGLVEKQQEKPAGSK